MFDFYRQYHILQRITIEIGYKYKFTNFKWDLGYMSKKKRRIEMYMTNFY